MHDVSTSSSQHKVYSPYIEVGTQTLDNSMNARPSKDKFTEKNTAIYMNVETVIVLILMVFNITNCKMFKMPKFSHSPLLETTKSGNTTTFFGTKWFTNI